MPPVIILNALFCTDSRISSSVSVHLQNTILAYSRPGRMKEVYIVVRVFLSNKYFSFARALTSYQYFLWLSWRGLSMKDLCLILLPSVYALTDFNVVLLNERGNSKLARFLLRVTVSVLLLFTLNLTSQVSAHALIWFKSSFNWFAAFTVFKEMILSVRKWTWDLVVSTKDMWRHAHSYTWNCIVKNLFITHVNFKKCGINEE